VSGRHIPVLTPSGVSRAEGILAAIEEHPIARDRCCELVVGSNSKRNRSLIQRVDMVLGLPDVRPTCLTTPNASLAGC
jgi:hypothetical protein